MAVIRRRVVLAVALFGVLAWQTPRWRSGERKGRTSGR